MALITVFGGTGFLGSRIVERLAGAGEIVRVATREPERLRSGVNPPRKDRAVPIAADVRDEKSVAAAVAGVEGVVNAVSAYVEKGDVTYTAIHVQGARNIALACERQKISRLIHISGIGADPASPSAYIRARGQGEQEVGKAFAQATILRPSVMFGRDDAFLNALVALARSSPIIPLVGGGRTRLQPVHVDDVAEAACAALHNPAAPGGIYEIGGPASHTLREIIEMVLARTRHRRILLPIPFALADPVAHLLERLPQAPLTVAQVDLLRADNVAAEHSLGLSDLGIVPKKLQDVIAELPVC
ncbi:MAG: complex I NDUFA9 subunit family protein [Acetobacteraceae bacterium]|nr:complex I NDUFA9 subunit family protein [Acetobacteraceae bacterium]